MNTENSPLHIHEGGQVSLLIDHEEFFTIINIDCGAYESILQV